MNILVIITPFTPAQTPNTLRWLPIIEQLKSKGHKVCVITSQWTNTKDELLEYPIYRFGHHTLLDFFYNRIGKKARRNQVTNSKRSESKLKSLLDKIINLTWRKHYWPDGSMMFLKAASKNIDQVVKEQEISHVISVGLPFSCHYLAYKAKLKAPSLHWTMDVEDPFSISKEFWVNNFHRYKVKNKNEETKVLALADAISFTNKNVLDIYTQEFPKFGKKYFIAPPLFDDSIVPYFEHSKNEEKKSIVYFGNFYENVRSPEPLLQFLDFIYHQDSRLLDGFEFHFYGEQDKFSSPIFEKYIHLRGLVFRHGLVSRKKTLQWMTQSHIVINFGNSTHYHLPSKVVDLLYINKPVLNIMQRDDDLAQAFWNNKLKCLNLNLLSNNFENLVGPFLDFINKHYETRPSLELVKPYLPEKITEIYLEKMEY